MRIEAGSFLSTMLLLVIPHSSRSEVGSLSGSRDPEQTRLQANWCSLAQHSGVAPTAAKHQAELRSMLELMAGAAHRHAQTQEQPHEGGPYDPMHSV